MSQKVTVTTQPIEILIEEDLVYAFKNDALAIDFPKSAEPEPIELSPEITLYPSTTIYPRA